MKKLRLLEIENTEIVVLMGWLWAANLIFFPVWKFGFLEQNSQRNSLTFIILWEAVSLFLLWIWLYILGRSPKFENEQNFTNDTKPHENPFKRREPFLLGGAMLFAGIISLIAINYPLTSSGDEATHAGTFRTIGRALNEVLFSHFSVISVIILLTISLLMFVGFGVIWWKWIHSPSRSFALAVSILALPVTISIAVPGISHFVDVFRETQLAGYGVQLAGLVRFQPFSKLLWLPVSILGWKSVPMLRLPAMICGLASGWVFYKTIQLRCHLNISILPAIYLIFLPGFMYYSHLVYLTTPMLLSWCIALYFYENYQVTSKSQNLVWTALALSVGNLIRLETAYLAMAMMIHWLFSILRGRFVRGWRNLLDGIGLTWFGLSLVPLWSLVTPSARPFFLNWTNWLQPARLIAIANDFPYHLGLIPCVLLIIGCLFWAGNGRKTNYSSSLITLTLIVLIVTYLLYTMDYLIYDERQIGIFDFGREWQTAHRFLVSWSPFIALLLAEAVLQVTPKRWQSYAGFTFALVLIAQATFWAAPLTLPEFTSLNLRQNAEYPYLPAVEVLDYVTPKISANTHILLSPDLSIGYYLNSQPVQGVWFRELWEPVQSQTIEKLIEYCRLNHIEIVIFPMVWMEYGRSNLMVSASVFTNPHFHVMKVFDYLGQSAIFVAEFIQ